MSDVDQQEHPPESAEEQIRRLTRLLEERDRELAELRAKVAELAEALQKSERAGKRQAAPFSRGKTKAKPKKPGRKPGHKGARRSVPGHVDTVCEAEPLASCPDCGGGIRRLRQLENFETDIPPVRPTVTKFVFYSGWCPCCQKQVQSTHPRQTSTATGAAASHLGPRLRALAAELKAGLGIPYAKIVRVLAEHFQAPVSAGGLVQSNQRIADQAKATVEAMRSAIAQQSLLHADETGWRVAAQSWWLWVVCNEVFTLYDIEPHRKATVILDLLGEEFQGILMRDGMASYDSRLSYRMLRCLHHLRRNAAELEKAQTRGAVRSPRYFQVWVRQVFDLKRRAPKLSPEAYAQEAKELVEWFDWFVGERTYSNERNAAFAKRLAQMRKQIVPIVEQPELPATNNLAERQIRPAVIARKISAGNKTPNGARTFARLASISATARQRGLDFARIVRDILLAPDGQPVCFWEPGPEPAPG